RKDYKHHGGTDIPIRMNSKLTSKGDRFDSFEQDYYSKHRPSEFNSGFESNLEPIKEAIEDFEKSRGKFDELKKLFGKETKDPLANMTEQEAKKYEEYEKAYKEEKKQIEQQESTPVEEELTPTQQQFINEQISEYDKLITDAEKSHRQAIKDRDNAMSEFNQANNLFREETEERNLFGNEGMTDVSNENARRINEQYQSAVDRAKTELDNLRNNRNSAIENIIREAKAQTEIPEPEKSIQKQLNDVGGDIIAHANNVVKKAEVRKEEGNVNTNPSEVQKEAGNYQKGHVNVQGFDITIENPKGSIRSGIDENGNQWSQKMNNTYGYIRGTKGKDGDHIDVFLGDNLTSDKVFVIDRVNPETGAFDEHKVMLGFNSTEEARKAYVSNYGDGSAGLGRITETNIANFRKWTENEGRRIKPFAEYKDNQPDVPELDDNFFTTEETAPFQITDQQFTPISKEAFGRLINRLKESGLARNVITDEKKMREYLGKKGVRAFQALADLSNAHSVSKFINDVLDGKIKKGEQLITIPYRINKIAEKKIGHQITSHKVRAEEIRHIKNEHGRARTEYPNDIPLRNEDIALLPYIMAAPDNILKGTTKGGRESVRYEKTLSNGNIIIVESEIRPKGTDMQNITMWAKKNHSTNAPSATLRASGATSETHISQNDVAKIMQDYEIAKQKEENNLRNDIRLMSTYKGEIYGFVTPEGDVYIDPTKLNANTPIHEFGHLFWNSSIPEEMKTEITNLLKQTPGWKKLENNPAYSNLKTDDQKADELFNTLLGNYGENNLQTREIMGDNISLFARIQNAINNFLQWLKAKFGNTTARLNEFAKQTLGNLLSGEELSPSQSQEGDTKNQSVNLENSKETNNFAENVEDNVRYNTEQILQSDSRMEYERISGRERNAEVAGRLESYRQTDRRNVSGTQSSKSKQEDELKKYAKQEGIWLDEKDIKANAERKIPSGKEADVYINKDGKTVTKVINYSKYSKTPAEFLDNRILLFNQLFDGTPYKIVGFTETNKGFSFVVEQPFIKGRLLDNLATSVDSLKTQQKRVEDYMLEKFGMEPSGVDAYSNGEITIEDVHLKNVIEGEDGNLYVIDAVPHFNESENEQNTEIKQPDSNVRFQIAPTTPTTQQYREELDKKLNRWQSKFAENWQDRYLPVKEFLDVLRKAGTDIKDYADFYLQSTHLAGKNDAQWES
ncbi:MAG: hypothetical protein FWC47_14475, partial [Oscillospiraceae bacterium]|nr:hypothetical protein [Oscillospiraceae bacterium]